MSTKPKILVIATQKGGVGKSTLSANLAITAQRVSSLRVGWIDTDPQGSLTAFYAARVKHGIEGGPLMANPELALPSAVRRLADAGCDLVVIDTPPSLPTWLPRVLDTADFVLVPTTDGRADMQASAATVKLIKSHERPFAFALTMVKGGTTLAAQATLKLSQLGVVAATISHRMVYKQSWALGFGVIEDGAGAKGPAAKEIEGLWDFLGTELGLIEPDKGEVSYA